MVIKMLAGSHRAIFKLPSPTEVILSFTIKKVSAITLNEQKKKPLAVPFLEMFIFRVIGGVDVTRVMFSILLSCCFVVQIRKTVVYCHSENLTVISVYCRCNILIAYKWPLLQLPLYTSLYLQILMSSAC